MMKLSILIPGHTTLSRRSKTLKPVLKRRQPYKEPLHLVVDSTGLSIHGEGPWASGKKRRRGWRKLHIMVDQDGFIHSSCVSKWYTRDGSRVSHLLKGIEGEISSLTGDRGYDQNSVYQAVRNKNQDAFVIIHPQAERLRRRLLVRCSIDLWSWVGLNLSGLHSFWDD